MVSKAPLVTSQPFKAFYTTYYLLLACSSVLFVSLRYLVPSLRPNPRWPYKLALNNELIKLFFEYWSVTRAEQPRISPEEQTEGSEFVTLPPSKPDLYRGVLAADDSGTSSIRPIPLNGVWIPQRPSSSSSPSDDFVVIHFHGGAFVIFSPQDGNVAEGLDALAKGLPVQGLLAPEFRLASRPGAHFPAQIQDAVTAYAHVLNDLGISPDRVVLSGDSAGGNIVVSLLRYLQAHLVLPLPAAALLHSPWLNLSRPACSVRDSPYCASDFLSDAYLEWGASSYVPSREEMRLRKSMEGEKGGIPGSGKEKEKDDREDGWISPLFSPFACRVPIWVQDGTAEVLHPDILRWVQLMRDCGSTRVEYYGAPDMMHNLLIIVKFMGLEKERARALKAARNFMQSL